MLCNLSLRPSSVMPRSVAEDIEKTFGAEVWKNIYGEMWKHWLGTYTVILKAIGASITTEITTERKTGDVEKK